MVAKSAIFVDFDNIFITLWDFDKDAALRFAEYPADWLRVLADTYLTNETRRWLVARCYLNPAGYVNSSGETKDRVYFSRYRPGLMRAGFDVIDCPALTSGGKNAADIRIVIDALDLLDHRTHFDEFVVASGDSDFTPLLKRLRAEDRRTAIVSPGSLSLAYASIADQVIGFDAIQALLYSDLVPNHGMLTSLTACGDSTVEGEAIFSNFIRQRYKDALAPLNLAALAFDAARNCPIAKQSNWFGKGSFSTAVDCLDLPHFCFSQHHIWDEERHQPPPGAGLADITDLPAPITLLVHSLELPRIANADWPKLFHVLSTYSAGHQFNLTEATRWCRDTLAQENVQIARNSISYVIRGSQLGRARVVTEATPSSTEIAETFLSTMLDRAASSKISLDTEGERVIAKWLGIHQNSD